MAHSYKWHCKRAGLPMPTGLATFRRESVPVKPAPTAPRLPKITNPDFILHTGRTLCACWDAKQVPGQELQSAVLLMLAELKRRVETEKA